MVNRKERKNNAHTIQDSFACTEQKKKESTAVAFRCPVIGRKNLTFFLLFIHNVISTYNSFFSSLRVYSPPPICALFELSLDVDNGSKFMPSSFYGWRRRERNRIGEYASIPKQPYCCLFCFMLGIYPL